MRAGSDLRTRGGFFDSLADSFAQNDRFWVGLSFCRYAPRSGVPVLRTTNREANPALRVPSGARHRTGSPPRLNAELELGGPLSRPAPRVPPVSVTNDRIRNRGSGSDSGGNSDSIRGNLPLAAAVHSLHINEVRNPFVVLTVHPFPVYP